MKKEYSTLNRKIQSQRIFIDHKIYKSLIGLLDLTRSMIWEVGHPELDQRQLEKEFDENWENFNNQIINVCQTIRKYFRNLQKI